MLLVLSSAIVSNIHKNEMAQLKGPGHVQCGHVYTAALVSGRQALLTGRQLVPDLMGPSLTQCYPQQLGHL